MDTSATDLPFVSLPSENEGVSSRRGYFQKIKDQLLKKAGDTASSADTTAHEPSNDALSKGGEPPSQEPPSDEKEAKQAAAADGDIEKAAGRPDSTVPLAEVTVELPSGIDVVTGLPKEKGVTHKAASGVSAEGGWYARVRVPWLIFFGDVGQLIRSGGHACEWGIQLMARLVDTVMGPFVKNVCLPLMGALGVLIGKLSYLLMVALSASITVVFLAMIELKSGDIDEVLKTLKTMPASGYAIPAGIGVLPIIWMYLKNRKKGGGDGGGVAGTDESKGDD